MKRRGSGPGHPERARGRERAGPPHHNIVAGGSKASVVTAIAANCAICIVKFLAAFVGGSAAMLSEAVHSGVDTIDDLLLLLGLHRSRRPPDEEHRFGHGNEIYFWSLIVSCSVLGVGGGVTGLEGILRLRHPQSIHHALWSYVALGCGVLFNSMSLYVALRHFRTQNRGKGFAEAVRETKDPSSFMVIFEDSAGVLGEIAAGVGIALNTHGWQRADGIASLLIALILTGEAVFLIAQMRSFIVGEGVDDDISQEIRRIASEPGRFIRVRQAKTMHFGPNAVLVTLDAEFDPNRSAGELMQTVDDIQKAIRRQFPAVRFIYVDPENGNPVRRRAA